MTEVSSAHIGITKVISIVSFTVWLTYKSVKTLTTLVGRLSLSVGWEYCPERGQDCLI